MSEARGLRRRIFGQGLESESLRGTTRERHVGQVLGFMIGLGGLVAATLLGLYGAETAATIIGGGTLVSLVSVFVLGREVQPRSKERTQASQDPSGTTVTKL